MHSRVHFTASYKQLAPNAPTDAFAGTGRIGACRVCDGLFCYPLGSVEDVDVRADVTEDECVPLPPDEKYFWSYTKQYTTYKRQNCALFWLIEWKRSRGSDASARWRIRVSFITRLSMSLQYFFMISTVVFSFTNNDRCFNNLELRTSFFFLFGGRYHDNNNKI